jgi:hypothetical protein
MYGSVVGGWDEHVLKRHMDLLVIFEEPRKPKPASGFTAIKNYSFNCFDKKNK